MTLKENVFLSAENCQVFITAEEQGACGERLSADEGLSGEEKWLVQPDDTSVLYFREQFNPWLHLQNNCLRDFQLFLAALLERALSSSSHLFTLLLMQTVWPRLNKPTVQICSFLKWGPVP